MSNRKYWADQIAQGLKDGTTQPDQPKEKIVSIEFQKEIRGYIHSTTPQSLDGKFLAIGSVMNNAIILNIETGNKEYKLSHEESPIVRGWSPNNKYLAAGARQTAHIQVKFGR